MSDDQNKQPQDKDLDFTVPTDLPDKSVDEDPFSAFRPDPEKYQKEMQSIENPEQIDDEESKDESNNNLDRYKPGYVEKPKEEPPPPQEEPAPPQKEPENITIGHKQEEILNIYRQDIQEETLEVKPGLPEGELAPRPEDVPEWETYKYHKPIPELEAEEKLFAGLSHLSNVVIFTAIWVPLIIYFIKPENDNIQFHAKQAALLGIPIALLFIILIVLSMVTGPCVCCFGLPFGIGGMAFWFYSIYITCLVFTGTNYRIPHVAEWADSIYG